MIYKIYPMFNNSVLYVYTSEDVETTIKEEIAAEFKRSGKKYNKENFKIVKT